MIYNDTLNCCGYENIKKILISEDELKAAVQAAGEKITQEYRGKPLMLIGILSGSFVFLADLCRNIRLPCEIVFVRSSSYGDSTISNEDVDVNCRIKRDISKYHVIIVEDIIDTGKTLKKMTEELKEKHPLSLKVYTLLDKPERREVDFAADYSLFTVPNLFVVGYGLDYSEKYRNLPFIAEASI